VSLAAKTGYALYLITKLGIEWERIGMADSIEIDFLAVGEGQRSGDAIAIRWREGDLYKVMVYDGGTKDYGQALVDHIQRYFQTSRVDYVVNSHPDNDHAGGLLYVVENLEIGELWMHRPWEYSNEIRHYFHDGRMTDSSLATRLQEKMSAAYALERVALKKGVVIKEPFAGAQIGMFTVLSPTRDEYVHELVPDFEKSPELSMESVSVAASLLDAAQGKVAEVIADRWQIEFLPDNVVTSAENESSAILYGLVNGRGYLLTGDAGIRSLRACSNYARSIGIDLPGSVHFAQIPHHGGRHNVSTEVLDLVLGKPLAERPEKPVRRAFVSVGAGATRHPKKSVTNAFIRRGFKVVETKGENKCHRSAGVAKRVGWTAATYVPFYDSEVEA